MQFYQIQPGDASAPASRFMNVTPNDAADLPNGRSRGLFVGVAGVVKVVDSSGNVASLRSSDSQYHPVMVARVLATGTDAKEIVALY